MMKIASWSESVLKENGIKALGEEQERDMGKRTW